MLVVQYRYQTCTMLKVLGVFFFIGFANYTTANKVSTLYNLLSRRDVGNCMNVDVPMSTLSREPGDWFNLYLDFKFECSGSIAKWELYSYHPGTVYVGVWRSLPGGTTLRLIGKNKITTSVSGKVVVDIGVGERIQVEPGDMVSTHYDRGATKGVISLEDSRDDYCCGVPESDQSAFYNDEIFEDTIHVGLELIRWEVPGIKRIPALKAYLADSGSEGQTCLNFAAPMKELNTNAGAYMNVFLDYHFECSGEVSKWEFFASTTGNLHVDVWRPQGGQGTLIGKNTISVSSTGHHTVSIDQKQRILVAAGDIIGVHFDSDADPMSGGVVWYEDNRRNPTSGVSAPLSAIYNSPATDQNLPLGAKIPLETNAAGVKRMPAIKAYVEEVKETTTTGAGPPTGPPTQAPTEGPPTQAPTGGPPTQAPTGGPPSAKPPSSTCGVPAVTPNTLFTHRIVGGQPAKAHSWPWIVYLLSPDGKHFCGGTLLDARWVVTAAHCAPGWRLATSPEQRRVVLGAHRQSVESPQQVHRYASHIITHPDYDPLIVTNDIAVIKLNQDVTFSDHLSPICLDDAGLSSGDMKMCFTAGWGHTEFMGSGSDVLNQIKVQSIDRETCNKEDWYNGRVKENMFCAGYSSGGQDSCQGDSGGPLMCKTDQSWKLVGVVSWGDGCALKHQPGVYTNVSRYINFIYATMERYG